MPTSIQISEELLVAQKNRKLHNKESCEQVIWDLIEDLMFLKNEVLQRIEQGLIEYETGTYFSMYEVFSDEPLEE